MSERRFTEAEVASIFERATESAPASQPQLASGEGMTLAELQAIGREVGIAPDSIARAALTVDVTTRPRTRAFLGMPIGVGHTVDLPRRLTTPEWELLVVQLRETFAARGVVRQDGSLRQWTNGNLQVLLEPTATGNRISMRTVKSEAAPMLMIGLVALAAGLAPVLVAATQGTLADTDRVASLIGLAVLGAGLVARNLLLLPTWARRRREQMSQVAESAALMAGTPPDREPVP